MAHGGRIARIVDALCQTFGDAQTPLDLGQQQHTAVRGQPPAVEGGCGFLASDGWKAEAQSYRWAWRVWVGVIVGTDGFDVEVLT